MISPVFNPYPCISYLLSRQCHELHYGGLLWHSHRHHCNVTGINIVVAIVPVGKCAHPRRSLNIEGLDIRSCCTVITSDTWREFDTAPILLLSGLPMIREAMVQSVQREEKRKNFREEAMAAWEEYQVDGLHVTHAEANDWLTELAAGHDVEPPECHT